MELFEQVKEPVYINHNGYLKGAPAYEREEEAFTSKMDPNIQIVAEEDKIYLELTVEKGLLELDTKILETKDLGMVRIVEAAFDDPQGQPIVFDTDYNGVKRTMGTKVGPFEALKEGFNRIRVWG